MVLSIIIATSLNYAPSATSILMDCYRDTQVITCNMANMIEPYQRHCPSVPCALTGVEEAEAWASIKNPESHS